MKVFDENGNSVGETELNREKFSAVKLPLLRQVIDMYEFNSRSGTASTKTRSEVAGGGRKPWAQKHLGRARAGSSRSPIWRGGGVTFGPKPGFSGRKIPKKVKRIALNSAITSKLNDEEVVVIDKLNFEKPNTKKMAQILDNLGINGTCLVVISEHDELVWKSSRNLRSVKVKKVSELNAYYVISQRKLLVTQEAVDLLNLN
ncbi:MAG: 50S ribosomal protein L4 [Candidatus Anammoxibacter sp.]